MDSKGEFRFREVRCAGRVLHVLVLAITVSAVLTADSRASDCNSNGTDDAQEITAGTSQDCDSNGMPDECDTDSDDDGVIDNCDNCAATANPGQEDCDQDGIGDSCDTTSARIYVDASAGGANDGTSWTNAFVRVKDALQLASCTPATEIWVARGTYAPDGGVATAGGVFLPGSGDRLATFQLADGVALYGGFTGAETDLLQRDLTDPANETILTGDLADDDLPNFANRTDNAFHVVTASGTGAATILDGFTIRGGNANAAGHESGGGVYNVNPAFAPTDGPTLRHCLLTDNRSSVGGAALQIAHADQLVEDCVFSFNSVIAVDVGFASPQFVRCRFERQPRAFHIGQVNDTGHVRVFNCAFYGHSSTLFWNQYTVACTLVNCVVVGNTVGVFGTFFSEAGAKLNIINSTLVDNGTAEVIYTGFSEPTRVYNSIIWNYTFPPVPPPGQTTNVIYDHCDIQEFCPSGCTDGTIDPDPQFVRNPDPGPDAMWGTDDDDYGDLHLQAGSPCADAGDNTVDIDSGTPGNQPLPSIDFEDAPRFQDDPAAIDTGIGTAPIVSLGAYESAQQSILFNVAWVSITEGATANFSVRLGLSPAAPIDVTVERLSRDADVNLMSGSLLHFDSTNYDTPQDVTLSADEDVDFLGGSAVIAASASGLNTKTLIAVEVDNDEAPARIYVDASAAPGGNGASWASALNHALDGILVAGSSAGAVTEIWVARGTYAPDGGVATAGGVFLPGSGDRLATFQLADGVALYGGFTGAETDLRARARASDSQASASPGWAFTKDSNSLIKSSVRALS